jgi:citrate synthase
MAYIPSQWTTEGFMQRYEELVKESRTYFDAYTNAEREHINLFGHPRYKNYDSFRMTRNQLILKK